MDWLRRPWTPAAGRKAAHPNARFTAPARQCPVIAPEWEDPKGVPISAILFGGRRAAVVPLVNEAFNWQHGTFLGSIMGSETTAAAAGKVGQLRRDPLAMLPFCGYHMGDYFAHWLEGRRAARPGEAAAHLLRELVPQGRATGKFLWPGYGENSRVLKWIFERVTGGGEAVDTPIGRCPRRARSTSAGLDDRRARRGAARWTSRAGSAELPLHRAALREVRRPAAGGAARGAGRAREAAQGSAKREAAA